VLRYIYPPFSMPVSVYRLEVYRTGKPGRARKHNVALVYP